MLVDGGGDDAPDFPLCCRLPLANEKFTCFIPPDDQTSWCGRARPVDDSDIIVEYAESVP